MGFFARLKAVFTRKKEPLKLGIALGSGGAKGMAHLGALKAFEEEGIRFSFVTGTSIGSIVGALYAKGYSVADMIEIIEGLNRKEFCGRISLPLRRGGDFRTAPSLRRLGDGRGDERGRSAFGGEYGARLYRLLGDSALFQKRGDRGQKTLRRGVHKLRSRGRLQNHGRGIRRRRRSLRLYEVGRREEPDLPRARFGDERVRTRKIYRGLQIARVRGGGFYAPPRPGELPRDGRFARGDERDVRNRICGGKIPHGRVEGGDRRCKQEISAKERGFSPRCA